MKTQEEIQQVIDKLLEEQEVRGYLKNSDFGMLKALTWVAEDSCTALYMDSGKELYNKNE